MINMEWKLMSKSEARKITASWQRMDSVSFNKMTEEWSSEISSDLNAHYQQLRKEVIERYQEIDKKIKLNLLYHKKKDYMKDLNLGLAIYEIFQKYGFSARQASIDQIWYFLNIKVFPDIILERYPHSEVKNGYNVNEDRFWKNRSRMYFKAIWWYVFLSLQKDENGKEDLKKTYDILKDNSTDEIVQLVERAGKEGYRVDVYREIMRFYSENRQKYNIDYFRKVMVLNTARAKVIEPSLAEGGVHGYVKGLFEYFD